MGDLYAVPLWVATLLVVAVMSPLILVAFLTWA